MGRLKMLRPSLTMARPRIATPPRDLEAERRDRHEWRAWYGLARWRRLRWECLRRDLFTCRMCGRIEADTSLLVADHIERHNGDAALFWDIGNLQCLCQHCHNTTKAREEGRTRGPQG